MKKTLKIFRHILIPALLIWLVICGILAAIIHTTGSIDEAENSDVIIVLGAGLTRSGNVGQALTRRALHAATLWQEGYAENIICTGGVGQNQTRSEADGCREILLREGIPDSAIFLEATSRSTEENALNSQAIMQANGWETAILVSDGYHIFRARYIFNARGLDVIASPVQYERIRSIPFYTYSVAREVAALHWQVFKDTFNLPITAVPIG